VPSSSTDADWFEQEPRLGLKGRELLERVLARGGFSWPIWTALALLVAGAATGWRLKHPPDYEATVVLRVTEGALGASEADGEELGNGPLRIHVERLAFSRPNLFALMARHPEAFPSRGNPELALESLRQRIDVAIAQNEFMEWHERDDDPPRSVQLTVNYRDPNPEIAWTIANDLAKLVIDTARGRTQDLRDRERAAADKALAQAGTRAEAAVGAGLSSPRALKPGDGAQERLAEVTRQATAAGLMALAADENQTLKFEVVDQGRVPKLHTRAIALARGGGILVALLLVGWLLAGAFDPRVLLAADIRQEGLTVLGALPALPGPPRAVPVQEPSDD
jgi:hypothetical protein